MDDATVLTQEIVENAERLGLTWQLRFATVKSVVPFQVLFDGKDTVAVPAIPLLRNMLVGDRVAVVSVPPAGQYVVGYANGAVNEANWINYTPSFTSLTGTNPTAGNHNLTLSRYMWITRNLICAEVVVIFGGSGFGTGVWAWGLPFAVNGQQTSVGVAHGLDFQTAEYPMTCKLANSTQIRAFATHTRGDVGPTVPFTWGVSDNFTAQIHYSPV